MAFPLIDEIPFSNVLIVDNKRDEVKDLEKDFRKRKISVIYAKKYSEAEAMLKQRPELGLIILDWRLDEQTSGEAKQLLQLIKKSCFAPIIIYTDQDVNDPQQYLATAGLNRIAKAYNKDQVRCQQVFDEIRQWFTANPELKIFLRWAYDVETRLNETLWAIHNLDVGGTRALLELLKPKDGSLYISVQQDLINLFGKVLMRKLGNDSKLLEAVEKEVNKLLGTTENVEVAPEKLQIFQSYEMYNTPDQEALWTGSILKSSSGKYFVVVTPICDFYQEENIEKIILIEAEPLNAYKESRNLSEGTLRTLIKNGKACVHYLAYTPTLPEGLICRFDKITSNDPNYLRKKLSKKEMSCIAIVESPFIENLIQRMNAYLMRLGVRSLDEREISRLARGVRPN